MTRQRTLLLNFERVRREMDELLGDAWGEHRWSPRAQVGFSPRVDVYYCGGESPRAIVKAELAGVNPDSITLEVAGRELVIAGERPVQETEGRMFQQVEIETGPFRRVVELGAAAVAEAARATYGDGILLIELPLRGPERAARRVPVEPVE